MTQPPPNNGDRWNQTSLVIAFVAAIGFPATFATVWKITEEPLLALLVMVIYGCVVTFVGLVTGVWKKVSEQIQDGAANDILEIFKQLKDARFRRPYLRYVIYRNRTFDVKGLSVQGPFALDLERVFVDLDMVPNTEKYVPFVRNSSAESNTHSIWDYLQSKHITHLAIIGAPGSGKTTLLKFVAMSLANRHWRSSKFIPNKLPILLFLRDHAKTIIDDPKVRLAKLVYDSLSDMEEKSPERWIENHLLAGHCLIMLDGLDEVANAGERRKIVD